MPSEILSAEATLLDYAVRLTHHRAGRKALFIALTALAPQSRTGHHWKLLDGVLGPVILRHGGEFFRLRCGDAVAVFTTIDRALSDRLSAKLVSLFRDDPLIERATSGDPNPLCTWWDLSADYDGFLAHVRKIKDAADDPSGPRSAHKGPIPEDDRPRLAAGTDPRVLPLVTWLQAPPKGAHGLNALARTASIVRWLPGSAPLRYGELIERSAQAVRGLGIPESEIERNPQLATPLDALIDRRIMSELPKARPNSAVLTVPTRIEALLSAELLAFHDEWALGAWSPVTWLVPLEEAEGNWQAYRYVREMLKDRGHRLGIGPVSIDAAPAVDLSRLKPFVVAMRWEPRFVPEPRSHEERELLSWLSGGGAGLTLLAGCDSREATAYGRTWGLGLYEGSQAEALVRGTAAAG